jgi:hypothetical protein
VLHRQVGDFEAIAGAAVLAAGKDAVVLALCVFVAASGAVGVSLGEQLGNIGLVEGAACTLLFWLLFLLRLLNLCRLGRGLLGGIAPAVFRSICGGLLLVN